MQISPRCQIPPKASCYLSRPRGFFCDRSANQCKCRSGNPKELQQRRRPPCPVRRYRCGPTRPPLPCWSAQCQTEATRVFRPMHREPHHGAGEVRFSQTQTCRARATLKTHMLPEENSVLCLGAESCEIRRVRSGTVG